jgi:putative membrane protein
VAGREVSDFGVSDFLVAAYPWIKALHIVAIIAWMAGLLYLPRLYVYHADVPPGSRRAAMLEIMERRLLRGIMLPAVVMTYAFGGLLVSVPGAVNWQQGWIWTKLVLVLLLSVFHVKLARWRLDFAAGRFTKTSRFYRMINEVPTVIMIAIVLLVVLKPF